MQCVLGMNRLVIINCETMLGAILVFFQRHWMEVLSLARNNVRLLSTPSCVQATVLNVDGSSFGNPGCSCFGGILRTSDMTWLCGFSGFFGILNNLHVQLFAIMHGLKVT